MMDSHTGYDTLRHLEAGGKRYAYFSLGILDALGYLKLERLPNALKILLENVLRAYELGQASFDEVIALTSWNPRWRSSRPAHFRPSRVLMQDFTGIPALVDLAALRDAVAAGGDDASRVNPRIPVDLVVDHSVMVEHFNSPDALQRNMAREFERNVERYRFLRWAQGAFDNLRVVPPGRGICHQVNLEYLATIVSQAPLGDGETVLFPDSLIGTDSHTTMVNALGVLGWGVGGMDAEAAMLGRPIEVSIPEVVGVRLSGRPKEGTSATDIVLTLTDKLRKEGVVGTFVEFCGEGLNSLPLPDRATLANMAPEYGATCAFFPVDAETLHYLAITGRSRDHVALVETFAKAQGWWRNSGAELPAFSRTIDLDLNEIFPCLAGPHRPQDRVSVRDLEYSFRFAFPLPARTTRRFSVEDRPYEIEDGTVVMAAITSCTNTSNPASMVAAGLLAKKAVARGLQSKPWVMTSLAPGSPVVSDYLSRLGLQDDLNALGFRVAAYGCAACVGNTAPLEAPLAAAIEENDLHVAAVLSGNRNFEARINPLIKANYLASPALVVAFALAGTLSIDLTRDPLGIDEDAEPVYLRDIWPSDETVQAAVTQAVTPQMFQDRYRRIFDGSPAWNALSPSPRLTYDWDAGSTYIRHPPFLEHLVDQTSTVGDITGARLLLLLGDGITTDHISPAGPIGLSGPAAAYLRKRQVGERNFNSYGARRGNHEAMVRGAFCNVRLRNEMVPSRAGGFTRFLPENREMSVFEAAMRYRQAGTPLVIVAGKDYGGGSSRDWAAKATALLGVKAVIAESFERIHRANLVAAGVLPLQFGSNVNWRSLGLDGTEVLSPSPLGGKLTPHGRVTLSINREPDSIQMVELVCRIDTTEELKIYQQGGLLPVLLQSFRPEAGVHTEAASSGDFSRPAPAAGRSHG